MPANGGCRAATAHRDLVCPVSNWEGECMGSELEQKYTRGKVLKRVGVGAAAAWSVPFLASSASASTKGVDSINSRCHNNGGVSCPDSGYCSAACGSKNGLACG